MNRHQRVAILAACTAVCATAPRVALAWGDDGHRIVGLIAEHYLDPAVLAQVNSILLGDNTGLVSPLDMSHEATWADKYRDSDRSTTSVRYNQTHLWHYVDLEIKAPSLDTACNHHPPVPAGTPASAAAANDCVVDKIEQFAVELASPITAAAERRLALQFLLHFVGDLHQPLHSSDDNDSGGNSKKVHGVASASSLHSAWDTPFVTALGSDADAIASALLAKITPALVTQWSQGAAADWAQEAFQLAKTEAYGKLPAPAADGSYTLGSIYIQNAQQVVEQQLSRAGVRLAWLLNRAIAPSPAPSPSPPPSPQQLIGNPGFEGASAAPWTATAGVISNDPAEAAHSGMRAAWLNGYGTTSTDRLSQSVTLPSGITTATLSFWLHVDTAETTKTKAYDKLTLQLLAPNGSVLKTLSTFSNLNAATGYKRVTYDLSTFKGQTMTIRFTGTEDNAKQTSFVVDDVSLDVQ